MGEFEKALEKYGKYVVQQARTNLTKRGKNSSKELYNSLSYKVQKKSVLFDMLDYGSFQDEGVKGKKSTYSESSSSPYKYKSKMPPSSVFDKWSIRKGIAPRDKQGRFISRKSLNYLLARSIYNKGIRATMFFTKPFEAGLDKFSDDIVFGFIEDNLKLEE
tara:strand:+ start:4985 stop:5467 length:483 start_codon:yes stop_codon:yes gene_type:complete